MPYGLQYFDKTKAKINHARLEFSFKNICVTVPPECVFELPFSYRKTLTFFSFFFFAPLPVALLRWTFPIVWKFKIVFTCFGSFLVNCQRFCGFAVSDFVWRSFSFSFYGTKWILTKVVLGPGWTVWSKRKGEGMRGWARRSSQDH